MWKKVEYPQQQSAASRARTQVERQTPRTRTDATAAAAPPSATAVQRVVKDLRRTASALAQATNTSLSSVLFPSVRAFLDRAKSQSDNTVLSSSSSSSSSTPLRLPRRVTVIGLGIGAFERRESRTGFVQMACFVALKQLCEQHEQSRGNTRTTAPASPSTACTVEARFYEPLASPLHKACCERLGITVEETNCFGRYTPRDANELLVLFMPHCPWVLIHNTFAANWPTKALDATGEVPPDTATALLPIQRVLWIANDLRSTPFSPSIPATDATQASETNRRANTHKGPSNKARRLCVYSDALLSCLDFAAIAAPKSRSKRARRTVALTSTADDDSHVDGVDASGLSAHDIGEAFSELAVMSVRADLSPQAVAASLATYSAKPPAIMEVTMEL